MCRPALSNYSPLAVETAVNIPAVVFYGSVVLFVVLRGIFGICPTGAGQVLDSCSQLPPVLPAFSQAPQLAVWRGKLSARISVTFGS